MGRRLCPALPLRRSAVKGRAAAAARAQSASPLTAPPTPAQPCGPAHEQLRLLLTPNSPPTSPATAYARASRRQARCHGYAQVPSLPAAHRLTDKGMVINDQDLWDMLEDLTDHAEMRTPSNSESVRVIIPSLYFCAVQHMFTPHRTITIDYCKNKACKNTLFCLKSGQRK
jgi:hypothetical protein